MIYQTHFQDHLESCHLDIKLGDSNVLKPTRQPYHPSVIPPVPTLPSETVPSFQIIPFIIKAAPHSSASAQSHIESHSKRRWTRMDVQDDEEMSKDNPIQFNNLLSFPQQYPGGDQFQEFIVRPIPPIMVLNFLSAPPQIPAQKPRNHIPPISIHYDVFAKRVGQLEKGAVLELGL